MLVTAKHKQIIAIVVAAVVLVTFGHFFHGLAEKKSGTHPTAAQAFQEMYHLPSPVTSHAVGQTAAEVWLAQEFNDGDKDIFVVFAQHQIMGEDGKPQDCHVCETQIDAITYSKSSSGWSDGVVQLGVTQIGSYGKVEPLEKADVRTLIPGNVVLFVPGHYSGQGSTSLYSDILNLRDGRWSHVGVLDTGGDDSGDCGPGYDNQCYEYSGSVQIRKGSNSLYPDIVVIMKGTKFEDGTSKIVKAADQDYYFNGTKYQSIVQAKNEAAEQALRRKMGQTDVEQPSPTQVVSATCEISNVRIDKVRVAKMTGTDYYTVTGIIRHNCAKAIGVQLKWTGFYADGTVAFVDKFWPNSTSNIPPNTDMAFDSLKSTAVPLDKSQVEVINVTNW